MPRYATVISLGKAARLNKGLSAEQSTAFVSLLRRRDRAEAMQRKGKRTLTVIRSYLG
jgi:hypothetical protein